MIELTPKEAGERLCLHAAENRLIQGDWHRVEDGRQLACALGSMHSEINSPADCPASVMPAWLAVTVPSVFDGMVRADATTWGQRFGTQMQADGWSRIDWDAVRQPLLPWLVRNAVASARSVCEGLDCWPAVESAAEGVVAAIESGAGGEVLAASAASAAAGAAETAAWAAAGAVKADTAARAAARAVKAAAADDGAGAGAAAAWAAAAAAWAASAQSAAAASAAAGASAATARKRQADKLCDLIDAELARAK